MILEEFLNVLASDINTAMEATGTEERLRLRFEKSMVSIEQITRSNKDRHHVDSTFILINATFNEANHYLAGFRAGLTFTTLKS